MRATQMLLLEETTKNMRKIDRRLRKCRNRRKHARSDRQTSPMPPHSITERKISHSLHFDLLSKEEALRQATFYQEQIGYYLANTFGQTPAFAITCEQKSDADRIFTLRKGSAVLTVETVFGINASYKEHPPRKFYTFTTTASHRNELLDTTDKANEVIEWALRIVGGLVLGLLFAVVFLLFAGPLGGQLIFLGFSAGAGAGGFIGQHLARRIYRTVEKRLDARGEVTEVEAEWTMLRETLGIIFTDTQPTSSSIRS